MSLTRRMLLGALPLLASATPLRRALAAIKLDGKLTQGGLVIGQAAPNSRVALDGKSIQVDAEGRFLLGFGRDAALKAELKVTAADGTVENQTLTITQRTYQIQHINNLPKNQVDPRAEELKRIQAEQVRLD